MPSPAKQDWLQIASEFETRWNFPNCVGAVDGKHVVIKSPAYSGSIFFNYKGTFSIVLLAVVDAKYSFVVIDVDGYGKQSDGGTLASSEFGMRLNSNRLDLPETKVPPGSQTPLPHVTTVRVVASNTGAPCNREPADAAALGCKRGRRTSRGVTIPATGAWRLRFMLFAVVILC